MQNKENMNILQPNRKLLYSLTVKEDFRLKKAYQKHIKKKGNSKNINSKTKQKWKAVLPY